MNVRKSNYIFIAVMLVFCGAVFALTSTYPTGKAVAGFGPAMFPRLLVSIIVICLVMLAIVTKTVIPKDATIELNTSQLKRPLAVLGLMIAYTLLLQPLGFIIVNFLFLIVSLKLLGSSWKTSLVLSVIVNVVLYVSFKIILQVQVPMGILFGG